MSTLRAISLLPSATDLVLALPSGLSRICARSHECDNGEIQHLPVVTGQLTTYTTAADVDRQVSEALAEGKALYTIDEAKIRELKPDVILTQSLCSVCAIDLATVAKLAKNLTPSPKIITLNPSSLDDVLSDLVAVGTALGMEGEAIRVKADLDSRVARAVATARKLGAGKSAPRVAFVEWPDPIFPAGHWTAQLIHMAGGVHPLNPPTVLDPPSAAGPSIRVTPEALLAMNPEVIVVAPCGLDLGATRKEVAQLEGKQWWRQAVGGARTVALVDGNQMFNRPGPRLVDALEFLVGLLWESPDIIPAEFPWEAYSTGAGNVYSAD